MFSGHLENVLEMLLLLGRIPDTQEDTRTTETFETFFKKKKTNNNHQIQSWKQPIKYSVTSIGIIS